MEVDQALIERLDAAPAVTAIVGERIYWVERPQGDALPAVVLQRSSPEERPQHLDGFEDMRIAPVQASCFATKRSTARTLAEAVIDALVPEATVADPDGSDVLFWRASVRGPWDLGDQPESGDFVHHCAVDLTIRYAKAG